MSLSKSPSSSSSSSSDGAVGLWPSYLHQLVLHPVRTKALTSGATAALATVLAQWSMGVPLAAINWTAVRNQTLIGLGRGPTIHYWSDARAHE
jgi:hypothetical protein